MFQMRRLQEEAGPDWLHLQVFWLILAATKKQPTFEVKSYFSLSQLLSLNLCRRCGGLFCSIHRYSDKHQCDFDYKVTPETPAIISLSKITSQINLQSSRCFFPCCRVLRTFQLMLYSSRPSALRRSPKATLWWLLRRWPRFNHLQVGPSTFGESSKRFDLSLDRLLIECSLFKSLNHNFSAFTLSSVDGEKRTL